MKKAVVGRRPSVLGQTSMLSLWDFANDERRTTDDETETA